MDLLFIGGTSFVGRHMTEAALERGHRVTLFHRGKTGADLFPGAEHILGDRGADLGHLAGRSWDSAIDVCGYVPREVRQVVDVLAGSVGRYCYVSSVSAYRPTGAASVTEDSPLWNEGDLDDPATEVVDDDTYGPLEALCEREAERGFGERATIVRPTYVVGPHDSSDRFTYWVRRAAAGGEMAAPGPAEAPIQLIDGRDLGAFTVGLVEQGSSGAYLGVGPAAPISFGQMVAACIEVADAQTRATWIDGAPGDFPLMEPFEEWEMSRCDPSKSLAGGLTLRPLAETIADTLAWDRARGLPPLKAGPSAEDESALLAPDGAPS